MTNATMEMARFLTVIVPVVDESAILPPFLDSLVKAIDEAGVFVETIFVDGGSEDDTVEILESRGMKVLRSERGRGNQIAMGVAEATGKWVLTLHADAMIAKYGLKELAHQLEHNPDVVWGILGHDYDERSLGLRLTAWFNALRFRFLGLAYGDQGIFFERRVVKELGGFPAQPLMEDVELSLMLEDHPRLRLGHYLTVSARQWRRRGFWSYTIGNLRLARRYLARRRAGQAAELLATQAYRDYYGDADTGKTSHRT